MFSFLSRRRRAPVSDVPSLDEAGRLEDMLAPDAFLIGADHAIFDGVYAGTMAVERYPSYAAPGWLAAAIGTTEPCDIALELEPMETDLVVRRLRRDLGRLEGAQYHADKEGQTMDAQRLKSIQQIRTLQARLQSDERVFNVSTYMTVYANSRAALERRMITLEEAFGRFSAGTCRLILEVLRGLRSTVPTAEEYAHRSTALSGESAMTLSLFGTPTLTMRDGIWYGINRYDGSFVIVDPWAVAPNGRPLFDNRNGCIVAKSGGGKSYFIKVTQVLRALPLGIHVIILDPENEYEQLASMLGGQVVRLSAGSPHRINPLDLPIPGENDRDGAMVDLFKEHIETVQGFLDLILAEEGARLNTTEKAILDEAIVTTYARFGITDAPKTHRRRPPTLADLMHTLDGVDKEYKLGLRLRRYAVGALSGLFGGQTTLNVTNPFTVFTLRELQKDLWPAAMYLVSQYVWGMAYRDRRTRRLFIVDEAQKLVREPSGAGDRLMSDMARRGRKYNYGLVAASQDAADFSKSGSGRDLLVNASWTLMLKQETAGIHALKLASDISDEEGQYLMSCDQGQGLLIVQHPDVPQEKLRIPLYVQASAHMEPYITTDPARYLQAVDNGRRAG